MKMIKNKLTTNEYLILPFEVRELVKLINKLNLYKKQKCTCIKDKEKLRLQTKEHCNSCFAKELYDSIKFNINESIKAWEDGKVK